MLNNNYKNEAINIMEQIKKAEETRLAMIKEAQETLVILGAESVVSTVEVQNVITINKGKIITIDNTNEKELKQLSNELKVYKGMAAGYEAQLTNKDLLISNLEKQIDDMKEDKLRNEIKANKELKTTTNDLEEAWKEIGAKQAIINKLEVKLAEALNKIAELEQAAVVVEEPVVEETKEHETKTTIDAYTYILDEFKIPEEDRNETYESGKLIFKTELKAILDKFNKLSEEEQTIEQLREIMDKTRAFARISRAKECVRVRREEIRLNQEVHAEYKTIKEEEGYVYGLQGTITINKRSYEFIFTNTHLNPVLYGCFNKETIEKAAEFLTKTPEWKSLSSDDFAQIDQREENTIYDFDNKIFIYKSDENIFKGYVEGYAFVWNTKEEVPCGTTTRKALLNCYRKMNESWGNGFVARAQMIKDACMKYFPECFNVTKDVKETNEVISNTNDEIDPDDLLE